MATPDLSRVFFTATSQLTDEDPGGAGEALYVYNDSADPKTTRTTSNSSTAASW